MRLVTTVPEVRVWRANSADSVGLVPTMGYLHAGHLSLLAAARGENRRVAATVFVNPTQFGPQEDLDRYPRDLERDRRLLADAGCDLLFAPSVQEMYPAGFASSVDVGPVAAFLEGERRPGHFRGVATIVLKLFGIFTPDRAYFGQKDAQQLAVIRSLVRDLNVPVEVRACPTVREGDGLALSSRNSYLSLEERRAAPVLHRALCAARDRWDAGEREGSVLRRAMADVLATEPRVRVDYASAVDPGTFLEVEEATGPLLLCAAVWIGRTRLIDNLALGGDQEGGC